jgi:hypothetical protein
MKPILILPPNHTEDDSAIWRAAIARGMSPLRCQQPEGYKDEISPEATVFYYGNVLHAHRVIEAGVSLRTHTLDPYWPLRASNDADIFGRPITPITYGEFSKLPYTEQFFVKHTAEKWFKPLVCSPATIQRGSSMDSDILHVQGIVKFVDEVRCFVVGGEICTWSYYRRNGRSWRAGVTETEPSVSWKLLVGAVARFLPDAVVVDVGLIEGDTDWHVIEANEPWASGIYDCDPDECLKAIIKDQS